MNRACLDLLVPCAGLINYPGFIKTSAYKSLSKIDETSKTIDTSYDDECLWPGVDIDIQA